MRELTPIEKALNALEAAHVDLRQCAVARARASDALNLAKERYDETTDEEYAGQSRLDDSREELRKLLVPAVAQVTELRIEANP